ncbi:profilin, required for normal timing of actin polymerization in response to thermal stress [Microsporum canis]
MSFWQAQVNSLLSSRTFNQAAAIDADGTRILASSSDFEVPPLSTHIFPSGTVSTDIVLTVSPLQINPGEMKLITSFFKDMGSGTVKRIYSCGFSVNGRRYLTMACEDNIIHGICGNSGVIIAKTETAVIMGQYAGSSIRNAANNNMTNQAQYLISMGQ